jgi:hypothetical protein
MVAYRLNLSTKENLAGRFNTLRTGFKVHAPIPSQVGTQGDIGPFVIRTFVILLSLVIGH